MFGFRSKFRSLIFLTLFSEFHRGTGAGSWRLFEPILTKLMAGKPILTVFFKFDHTLDFYRRYPSQQILSNPRRWFKICPYPRILVVSGLQADYFNAAFNNRVSRLCPLGTVYVLLEDLRLHAYNNFNLLPFSALRDPQRKGLFYGVSLNWVNWKQHLVPEIPSTWKDEYLRVRAPLVNLIVTAQAPIYDYELIFRIGNCNMINVVAEFRYHPSVEFDLFNVFDLPRTGSDTPIVIAVFKPQKAATIADEYSSMPPVFILTIAFSFIVALFLYYNSRSASSHLSALTLTLASLISAVPLNNCKSSSKLLFTFGLWLFLGQIFVSLLKGEMVKNVSLGPTEMIKPFPTCEPNYPKRGLKVEHMFSATDERDIASSVLLGYSFACFYDVAGLKPFRNYFTKRFPKAQLYDIKLSEESIKVLKEVYYMSRKSDMYGDGHVYFRIRICPIRGNMYFQKLLEGGLYEGSKHHEYRVDRFRSSRRILKVLRPPRFVDPKPRYARHVKLLEKIGLADFTTHVDYGSWVLFASSGWLCSVIILFGEMAVRVMRNSMNKFEVALGLLRTLRHRVFRARNGNTSKCQPIKGKVFLSQTRFEDKKWESVRACSRLEACSEGFGGLDSLRFGIPRRKNPVAPGAYAENFHKLSTERRRAFGAHLSR